MRFRKSMKFIGLLLTALFIATVSAATYRYMYIEGAITVTSAKLVWLEGTESEVTTNIAGSTASISVSIEQGTPVAFTNALYLKNTNTTGHFHYNITTTTELSSADFERANMLFYENYTIPGTWSYIDTLDLTDANDFSTNSLNAQGYIRMCLELNATIATGTRNFIVQLDYWA